MYEMLVAQAVLAEREADYLAKSYQYEWHQMRAIDRLEKSLRLRRSRLAIRNRLIPKPASG